mgnify:CR=1 FL=1
MPIPMVIQTDPMSDPDRSSLIQVRFRPIPSMIPTDPAQSRPIPLLIQTDPDGDPDRFRLIPKLTPTHHNQ